MLNKMRKNFTTSQNVSCYALTIDSNIYINFICIPQNATSISVSKYENI